MLARRFSDYWPHWCKSRPLQSGLWADYCACLPNTPVAKPETVLTLCTPHYLVYMLRIRAQVLSPLFRQNALRLIFRFQ